MDLGEYFPCLKVHDLRRSIEFYRKLDFVVSEDHGDENWAVLQHNNMVLCLYQGHLDNNLINFRGGDVEAIHEQARARGLEFCKPAVRHPDGSWSAELLDPDGNRIYFNTFPAERQRYLDTGRLIDYSPPADRRKGPRKERPTSGAKRPLHIGVVACSAEGAALCYRTLCAEGEPLLGAHAHPEVSLHTHSLADYVACMDRDDWAGVGELMLSSAEKLAAAGADFLICPDNTIHQALPTFEARTPLPWLHIAEVVAAEAKRRGFERLGLTGTRWLVESSVYPDKLGAAGLEHVLPEPEEREQISRIIMEELVRGVSQPRAVAYIQGVIGKLKQAGCDAVILGCTEIPLIIDDSNSPLPTLDSTRLLARAALQRAIASETGAED